MVNADDVIALVELLRRNDLTYWIAGGWGVDALLGRVTRHHHDLDLHVDLDQIEDVTSLLEGLGYAISIDQAPIRVEMTHRSGKVIDLHPLRIDHDGSGHGPMVDGGSWIISSGGLNAEGTIHDMTVSCVSVAEQIRDHCEFEPRPVDWDDMGLLADAFGVPLPHPYDESRTNFD